MDRQELSRYMHPKEQSRFGLALAVSGLVALPIVILIVMSRGLLLFIGGFVVAAIWLLQRVTYARLAANSIRANAANYPRVHEMTQELIAELGVKKKVEAFIYEQGEFNAFLQRHFARRQIMLNSELLEKGVTDAELRWLVGRFVGMVRAREVRDLAENVISFASKVPIVNFFIRPYERATAYTGDRIALAKIEGDISSGVSVMNKLLVGRTLGYSVNPAGVVDQNLKAERDVFTTISRLTMPLPHTLTRYADLIEYARVTYPDQYARFAAENPGLAEPEAAGARHDGGGLRLPGVLGGQAGGVKRGSND